MIKVDQMTPEPALTHELQLEIGEEQIISTVQVEKADDTESAERFQVRRCPIGQIHIASSGEQVLRVCAKKIDQASEAGLRLVDIELAPSK
jgi:hypothetical protein